MHLAAEKGRIEYVDMVYVSLAQTVHNSTTQWYSVVKELLGYCSNVKDIDQDGNTPLHLACIHGFVNVAKVLVESGADVEAR